MVVQQVAEVVDVGVTMTAYGVQIGVVVLTLKIEKVITTILNLKLTVR